MPWVTFSEADVKARLAVRELENYEETASMEGDESPGIEDRLPAIIVQTLGLFRGKIRSNPQVSILGPDGTLPDFCIFPAAVIARVALIGLNPVQEGMTDPRRDEYREAMKDLNALSSMGPSAFDLADPSTAATTCGAYGGSALLQF